MSVSGQYLLSATATRRVVNPSARTLPDGYLGACRLPSRQGFAPPLRALDCSPALMLILVVGGKAGGHYDTPAMFTVHVKVEGSRKAFVFKGFQAFTFKL